MGVVSFAVPTGVVGTTLNVTGFTDADGNTFNPTIFIFRWSGATSATDSVASGHVNDGIGFAASATDRRCVYSHVEDAGADSICDNGHRADSIVVALDNAGAIEGILDIDALITNGLRIIVDDQFVNAYRVHVLGILGHANAETDVFNVPTTGTPPFNQDITSIAFQGDIVLFAWAYRITDPPSNSAGSHIGFGAAVSSTQQGVVQRTVEDAQMVSDSAAYGLSAECVAISNVANANTVQMRAAFSQFLSNGFQLTWQEIITTANRVHVMVIKGGSWAVGESATRMDGNDIVVSGLSFKPAGGIIASVGRAESTADTPTADAETSIGFFVNPTTRGVQCIGDDDAADPMDVSNGVEYDEVLINITPAGVVTAGLMDMKSRDTGGATFVMDDVDTAASWFMWVMGGDPGSQTYTETGFGAKPHAAYGADLAEFTDIGAAASPHVAISPDATEFTDQAAAESPRAADGIGSLEFTQTGEATSPRAAEGADLAEYVDSGAAQAPRAADGPDAVEYVATETASSPRTADGAGFLEFTQTGDASTPHAADGADVFVPAGGGSVYEETGTGISPFEASGVDAAEYIEIGAASSPVAAFGAESVEYVDGGAAVAPRAADGADIFSPVAAPGLPGGQRLITPIRRYRPIVIKTRPGEVVDDEELIELLLIL